MYHAILSISLLYYQELCVINYIKTLTLALKAYKNIVGKSLTLSRTSPGFTFLQYKSVEHAVRKGETIPYKQFPFSHGVFYQFGELSAISSNMKLSSAKFLSLEGSKIFCFKNIISSFSCKSFIYFPRQTPSFYNHFLCLLQILSIWTFLKFC